MRYDRSFHDLTQLSMTLASQSFANPIEGIEKPARKNLKGFVGVFYLLDQVSEIGKYVIFERVLYALF